MREMDARRPESTVDLYSDEALLDPYPHYRALRAAGGAVWLSRHDMFVLSRYQDVRDALRNWEVFSSASGVTMNQPMNDALAGNTLCSDAPKHDVLRGVIAKPLSPIAVRSLTEEIDAEAERLVERLVARRRFDAATDLAQHLPVSIVSNLVGLPESGRERMLEWAAANFNCFGPLNQRTVTAFDTVKEMIHYAYTEAVPGKLKPGGWAAMIYEAADRGEIRHDQCPAMMNDYMGPSLDTTIFATANAVWLFANHPEQWDAIRADPSLIPNAVNEVLRLESPIQGFSRMVTRDHVVDGVTIPAGSRTIVLYGSANRDERKWEDPERFDVRRRASEHLAFGQGPHTCVGMPLARLEIKALLAALAKRVKRFELGETRRAMNNVLRGFEKVEVTVH
jgi:cytochrome P450